MNRKAVLYYYVAVLRICSNTENCNTLEIKLAAILLYTFGWCLVSRSIPKADNNNDDGKKKEKKEQCSIDSHTMGWMGYVLRRVFV